MTIAQLLSSLLNLGKEADFWNSSAAALDFWIIFAAMVILAIATLAVRQARHGRRLRHH